MRERQQGTRRRSEYWVFEKENNNYFRRRAKLGTLLGTSDPGRSPASDHNDDDFSARNRNASGSSPAYCSDSNPVSGQSSPAPNYYNTSPWNPTTSPYVKSPWNNHIIRRSSPNIVWPKGASGHAIMPVSEEDGYLIPGNELLIGSLVREEGHVYSLAAAGDLLYTGSDSKNIRVWKNQKEFSGFKSNSGLVKAIVVHGDRIFTGHQDGKIRVWKASSTNPAVHKRAGTLPTFKDFLKCSMNPNNYVEVRRHRNSPWIKHYDAVSCLSLNEEEGLLYSGSWDKTMKVWRVSDSKCLESINAHDDAINSVVAGFEGLVFTGSADGTVKVWKREIVQAGRRRVKHFYVQTLLRQESAVTALAVLIEAPDSVLYCGSSDGTVNFWEKEKHHLAHGGVLRGHKLAVLCLAAAGNLVFSGSADKTICVWRREPASGVHTCLTVLVGHAGPVKCLAVDEDRGDSVPEDRGRWILYSGSLDKSVKVWKVSETTGEEPNLRLLPPARSVPQSPLMSQATLPKP